MGISTGRAGSVAIVRRVTKGDYLELLNSPSTYNGDTCHVTWDFGSEQDRVDGYAECPDPKPTFLWHPGSPRYLRLSMFPCGRWICEVCSLKRADKIIDHLSSVSAGRELYAGCMAVGMASLPRNRLLKTTTKSAERKSAQILRVTRADESFLLVSDVGLKGQRWTLRQAGVGAIRDSVVGELNAATYWSERWRPSPKEEQGWKVIGHPSSFWSGIQIRDKIGADDMGILPEGSDVEEALEKSKVLMAR